MSITGSVHPKLEAIGALGVCIHICGAYNSLQSITHITKCNPYTAHCSVNF